MSPSPRAADLTKRVAAFVAEEIDPIEPAYRRDLAEARRTGDPWQPLPVIEELKAKARAQGLWNFFLPNEHTGEYAEQFGTDGGAGLSNSDYARSPSRWAARPSLAPYVFNCHAPDTGNMEVLLKYGSEEQKTQWLEPLLDGAIRSAFTMTEPGTASSDATNMEATAVVDGDEVVVTAASGGQPGGHPDCRILVFMGSRSPTDAEPEGDRHHRHTMVLVPLDTPGVKVERLLSTMNLYDEPVGHGEVSFDEVRVPKENILLGEGRAFEIAQGRLGPGRVHHCMRLIGQAEVALAGHSSGVCPGRVRQAVGQPRGQPGAGSPTPGSRSTRPGCWCSTPRGKLDVGGPLEPTRSARSARSR